MEVTIAINHGNTIVSRKAYTDPYAAFNRIRPFYESKMIAAVVKCAEIYTIGKGEYEKKSCSYCPLEYCCLCENRVFLPTDNEQ